MAVFSGVGSAGVVGAYGMRMLVVVVLEEWMWLDWENEWTRAGECCRVGGQICVDVEE